MTIVKPGSPNIKLMRGPHSPTAKWIRCIREDQSVNIHVHSRYCSWLSFTCGPVLHIVYTVVNLAFSLSRRARVGTTASLPFPSRHGRPEGSLFVSFVLRVCKNASSARGLEYIIIPGQSRCTVEHIE